ncbi:MAG: methyltransferase [Isosphaeraceae bacterium]|nr:methyltransferase [Isosphaeraceae bacterium]
MRTDSERDVFAQVSDRRLVGRFLADAVSARILQTAIEVGLIDSIAVGESVERRRLAGRLGLDERAVEFLLGRLVHSGIIEVEQSCASLSLDFRRAWEHRELIEIELEFANLTAPDFFDRLTTAVLDPSRFFDESELHALFDYAKCESDDPAHRRHIERWVRYTTLLTRYEAPILLSHLDLSNVSDLLEIGGNSGELALAFCREYSKLRVAISDLPAVCRIGREHVGRFPEAERIEFLPGDPTERPPHRVHDVVLFKSMLHDWPTTRIEEFLQYAFDSLRPGGRLIVFERAPIDAHTELGYGSIPLLLFFRAYRDADEYRVLVESAGFTDFESSLVEVDLPFHLFSARRPMG